MSSLELKLLIKILFCHVSGSSVNKGNVKIWLDIASLTYWSYSCGLCHIGPLMSSCLILISFFFFSLRSYNCECSFQSLSSLLSQILIPLEIQTLGLEHCFMYLSLMRKISVSWRQVWASPWRSGTWCCCLLWGRLWHSYHTINDDLLIWFHTNC